MLLAVCLGCGEAGQSARKAHKNGGCIGFYNGIMEDKIETTI